MWGKHHESKTPSRPTSPRAADYSSGSSCPATGKPQPRLASLSTPPGQVEPLIGDGAAESARPICPAKRCRGESTAAVGQHDATRPTTNAQVDTAYEPGCLHTASADAQCIAGGAVEGDCPGPPGSPISTHSPSSHASRHKYIPTLRKRLKPHGCHAAPHTSSNPSKSSGGLHTAREVRQPLSPWASSAREVVRSVASA